MDAHGNFAYSTVATAPSPASSGTSLVVAAGEGSKFPAVPFNATVWPASVLPLSSNAEIVRVTNIAADTLTITRAQESSSARTIVVGDQIAATITKKTLTDIETASYPPNGSAGGDLTGTYPSPTLGAVVDGTKMAGWTVNAQVGTTYTLVLTDAFKILTLNNAGAITLTIPTNASVAIPVGSEIVCTGIGVGLVTVAAAGGVTINNPTGASLTLAKFMVFRLVKIATDTWEVNKGARPPDSTTLDINASGQIERMALTGDVTASAGSAATTIATAAVTSAKMADMAAKTVKMRHTNSTGVPEDTTMANLWTDLSAQSGASVSMNSQKFTSLAAGTATGESIRYEQVVNSVAGHVAGGLTGATAATRYVGGTALGAPTGANPFLVGDFVIDDTGHVYVCVTAGSPGTWTCVTKSRHTIGWGSTGLLVENGWPGNFPNSSAFTTQTVYGTLLGLRAGDSVTGILMRNTVAAVGAGLPTTVRAGIADSTGKVLAISGNLNAAANFPLGPCALALSAPYTILADGGYFACIVANGVWTTPPTPMRGNTSAIPLGAIAGGVIPGFAWTGQTDLPAVSASLTITSAMSICYYMGFY